MFLISSWKTVWQQHKSMLDQDLWIRKKLLLENEMNAKIEETKEEFQKYDEYGHEEELCKWQFDTSFLVYSL